MFKRIFIITTACLAALFMVLLLLDEGTQRVGSLLGAAVVIATLGAFFGLCGLMLHWISTFARTGNAAGLIFCVVVPFFGAYALSVLEVMGFEGSAFPHVAGTRKRAR